MKTKAVTDHIEGRKLSSGELAGVTGLSYRQLNEWDKRDSLPHERNGKAGWRRFDIWQVISLRIIAEINHRFGTPLVKQRRLLDWMIGQGPGITEELCLALADQELGDFKLGNKPANGKLGLESLEKITTTQWTSLSASLPQAEPVEDKGTADGESLTGLESGIKFSAWCLESRGWPSEKARDFARRFHTLTTMRRFGAGSVGEIIALGREAQDRKAREAVQMLARGLLPIFGAIVDMTTGFQVFLVTDLKESLFVIEPTLIDFFRDGMVSVSQLMIPVSEHVNAVLEKVGKPPIPITMNARDIENVPGENLTEQEGKILEIIRNREFDRLIIEAGDARAGAVRRLQIERDLPIGDEKEIAQILKEHAYQSVTVKRHNGKIARLRQEISIRL